ncbi:MAG: HEAT repeat domain-containing protein [Planctomycetota bacterium]|jgi:HEAT repeat protein
MKKGQAYISFLCALIWAGFIQTAQADMRLYCLYEFAERSDVVFTGTVTAVSDKQAKVTVTEVLFGEMTEEKVSVSPTKVRSCVMEHMNFAVDESVLIFGTRESKGRITVVEAGYGKRTLDVEDPQATLATVRRILVINVMDEDARHKAMLTEATNKDDLMRFEAHHYITGRIGHGDQRDRYKDELIALIENPDPQVQRTGLQGVEYIRDADLVPLLVECTQQDDMQVIEAASMALKNHDTPESAAALIALTRHMNPKIRIRAAVDLGNGSTQPEAIEALTVLLDDPETEVRAMTPRRFVRWFRRGQAGEVIPKLVEMLEDENWQVRSEAAHALGEYRTPETVGPLLDTLKKSSPQDGNVQWMTLNALYCHCSKGGSRERAMVDEQIDLVAGILLKSTPNTDYRTSFNAVGILSFSSTEQAKNALQWAAIHHDKRDIRDYAKRCLTNEYKKTTRMYRQNRIEAYVEKKNAGARAPRCNAAISENAIGLTRAAALLKNLF